MVHADDVRNARHDWGFSRSASCWFLTACISHMQYSFTCSSQVYEGKMSRWQAEKPLLLHVTTRQDRRHRRWQ